MNNEARLVDEIGKLKREVERLKRVEVPLSGGGGGVTDHGALTGLLDNDHPQYSQTTHDHAGTYLPIAGKAADADKLDNIDSSGFVQTSGNQTVGGVKTFSSIPVLPATNPTLANQAVRKGYADAAYLSINGKAADADRLDGIDSTGFALSDHNHDTDYLGKTDKAADSDKLDGLDSTEFVKTSGTQTIADVKTFSSIPVLPASNPTTSNQAVRKGYADAAYLGISAKAADSDKLDGIDSTGFALSDHNHDTDYLGKTDKAADSDKLDGLDSTEFVKTSGTQTIADVKTFSSIPVLPASNPTTSNQAVRKGYADAAYLGISAKAADSDKLDGLNSTDFGRPVFLAEALTSTSWDGDSFSSTTANTKIDLSDVFGVPAGVKAVLVNIALRDSGSAANECFISLTPSSSVSGLTARCSGIANDKFVNACLTVPCDTNGDIYYQITASGTGTMDVYLQIWGYWL